MRLRLSRMGGASVVPLVQSSHPSLATFRKANVRLDPVNVLGREASNLTRSFWPTRAPLKTSVKFMATTTPNAQASRRRCRACR